MFGCSLFWRWNLQQSHSKKFSFWVQVWWEGDKVSILELFSCFQLHNQWPFGRCATGKITPSWWSGKFLKWGWKADQKGPCVYDSWSHLEGCRKVQVCCCKRWSRNLEGDWFSVRQSRFVIIIPSSCSNSLLITKCPSKFCYLGWQLLSYVLLFVKRIWCCFQISSFLTVAYYFSCTVDLQFSSLIRTEINPFINNNKLNNKLNTQIIKLEKQI